MITRDDLDEISSSVPICIVRICGHIAVLNSAALELLRASAEVEAYAHNIDWDSGVLRESAVKYCYKIMPPIPKPIMKNLIDMAQRALLSQGITAVGTDDFISLPGNNLKVIYESYQEMAKEGELKVRVSEQCGFVEVKDLEDFIAFNRKSTHNRRERPVHGHRGRSRGPFYYRITTFGEGPWDARDPHKTTFMTLK